MPTVHFYWEVLPRALPISLPKIIDVSWEDDEVALSLRYLLEIKNSQVHVTVHTDKFSEENLAYIYMQAWDYARAAAELVAFRLGWGIDLVFSKFVGPDGVETELAFPDERLADICKSYDLEKGFFEMVQIVLGDPSIFSLLHDLIRAITVPHASTMACARVVDGIKHRIASGAATRSQEWLQMREALRLDKTYLKPIIDHSKDYRHGKNVRIAGDITSEMTKRTWTIMDRFLEYRKRNTGPLPVTEFPVLFG